MYRFIFEFFCLVVVSIICLIQTSCSSACLTPQLYGAKADGMTDCTDPIRRMLINMKERGVRKAYFKEGEYLISDGVIIDFPCKIKGKNATIISKDTLHSKYAFLYTKSAKGSFMPNTEQSELCLNFKVHAIPVAFHGFNNVYMHDCCISTFTGEDTYSKDTKFWFAIDCDRFYYATFKNIRFDQPVNYKKNQFNSADGLHITGQCHDIVIDGCYGHTGDDFIALNANENTPGDIRNISIRNCCIGSDTLSKNGIRIYGMSKNRQLKITNVSIENCTIDSSNSPSIYFTNNANTYYSDAHQYILLDSISIKNCYFTCPEFELATGEHPSVIRFSGVDCRYVTIDNVHAVAHPDSLSYFINVIERSDIDKMVVRNCSFNGENALRFIKIGKDKTARVKVNTLSVTDCKKDGVGAIENNIEISDLNLSKNRNIELLYKRIE